MAPASTPTTSPGALLFRPDDARVAASQLASFQRAVERETGLRFEDYAALHRWSVEQLEVFWGQFARWAQVPVSRTWERVLERDAMPGDRWFPGAQLNYAQALLEGSDDPSRTALIGVDERGVERRLSYAELREQVRRCAAALRALGVAPREVVAAYLPNDLEAVVLLLACASVGATFTSCSPDFGVEATVARFSQVTPKLLVTASAYLLNGKVHSTRAAVEQLVARLAPSQVVEVSPDAPVEAPRREWSRWLADAPPAPLEFEPLPFHHPLYILYTSGTTGAPKCLVHRAGGALLTHLKEHRLHCDLRPGDVLFFHTSSGWMMWNWMVSALASGATVVAYSGGLAYPSRDAVWSWVERLGVTHFGSGAVFLHGCERRGADPRALGLSRLRCVLSTGSPLPVSTFEWVYTHVSADVHLASISGGTEIVGCFLLGNPTGPVHAGELQCAGLGVSAELFDEHGAPCERGPGELVCTRPLPSMPDGLWNDPDGARFQDTYFRPYPGVWRHGDWVERTVHGGYVVHGRSDATLKPGGVRVGSSDIYRALHGVPEVEDALVFGKQQGADVAVWLLVTLRAGAELNLELKARIGQTVLQATSASHVPQRIFQVRELPRTRNGKLMEGLVTRLVNGVTLDNVEAVANRACLEDIAAVLGVRSHLP